jgi:alcohol dehydrogenase class IV
VSHALESIWNVNATEDSARRAVSAATEILEVLPMLAEDPDSLELRTRMAGASQMSGMAFSTTKTAIAHSISYPMPLLHNIIHCIACSFTLPIVLKSLAGNEGPCGRSLKQIIGDNLSAVSRQMTDCLASLGVSAHSKDRRVRPQKWVRFVDEAFTGECGLNFIGTKESFDKAAKQLSVG